MYSNKNNIRFLIATVIVAVLSFGCVKKRDDLELPGTNLNDLISVNEVKSWKHSITTTEALDKSAVSEAQSLVIETTIEKERIAFPKIVKFDTDSPLLKPNIQTLDLFGMPNTKYPLIYEFTPKFLKLYKLVKTEQLSHYELPYAVKTRNGYLVPVGGYEATYYNTGKQRNEDNRETNIKGKFSIDPMDYKTASHVYVNKSAFRAFERQLKLDVLPADYFTEGEWYYASSIVSTKPGQEQKIGFVDGTVDASLRKLATKIKFTKINNFLRGINVVRDDRVEFNEDYADDVINIRVDWVDYRTTPAGDEGGLGEEEHTYRSDVLREYGKFYFAQTSLLVQQDQTAAFLEGVFKGIKIDSLIIKPDSFSYTLIKTSSGEKVKYSFLRAKERNYTERVYFQNDRNKFGYFENNKFKLSDYEDHREEDFEKNVQLSRSNPNKDILFKFSTLTPTMKQLQADPNRLDIDYRLIARQTVKRWNRVFELSGAKSRLKILEGDAELGELDVNIINVIDNIGGSGLLGVGPTVADPNTGEIISGTVNVYVGPLINSAASDIRDYIKIKTGIAKDVGFSREILSARPLYNYMSKEIEHFCPEVKSYVSRVLKKASNREGQGIVLQSAEENIYVNSCLVKLLPKRVASVIAHEIGHSPVGLRHNFFASSDKANSFTSMKQMEQIYPRNQFPEIYEYYSSDEFLPAGSSIMDYAPFDAPYLAIPGPYDIAAVAYGYANKIEVGGARDRNKTMLGEFADLNPELSLENQPIFSKSNRFKFCNDEHVDRLQIDPLCKRYDYGYDPLSALDYYFNQYRDFLVLYGQRLDRVRALDYSGYRARFMVSMIEIYAAWRAYVHDYVGEARTYLDHITPDMRESFKKELMESKKFKQKEYIGVTDKFFSLMSEILFLPDLYCVGVDENKKIKLYEFEKLQKEVIGASGYETVTGCDDTNLISYVKNRDNLEIVTSIGLPVNNIQYSLSMDEAEKSYDILGILPERINASIFLAQRAPPRLSYLLRVRGGLAPSLMDESYMYSQLRGKITDRILNGLDVRASLAENLQQLNYDITPGEIPVFKKFDTEWPIFQDALGNLINSSMVPGKPQRMVIKEFLIGKTNTKTNIDPGSNVYEFNGNYFFAKPDAVFINQVFEKLIQLDQPLFVNLKNASQAQQVAFKNFLGAIKNLPLTEGPVTAQQLQDTITGIGKLLSETVSPEEKQAIMNGASGIMQLQQAIGLQFAAMQSGQTDFKVEGTDKVINGQKATEFFEKLSVSTDVSVELKEYLQIPINLTQQSLVSSFVKTIGTQTYENWVKQTEKVLADSASLDEDEKLDVMIQSENLRKMLNVMPGASK